jgi:N-methylhydantoinase A/oxoprolinase/acetone carboxylase beta subunit
LTAGSAFAGPAIVEQYDTTSWIPAGWSAVCDGAGNVIVEQT